MFKNKNKVECEQWRYLLKVTKPAFAGFVDQFDAIDDSLDLGKLREKKINISEALEKLIGEVIGVDMMEFIRSSDREDLLSMVEFMEFKRHGRMLYKGGLDFTENGKDIFGEKTVRIPGDWTIDGNFFIKDLNVREIPRDLLVSGNMDIRGTLITDIPDDLVVEGELVINQKQLPLLGDKITKLKKKGNIRSLFVAA